MIYIYIYNNNGWGTDIGVVAKDFAGQLVARADRVLAVAGMSASTWQYDGAFAEAYDAA